MKYTIVSKREYNFKDAKNGEDVQGFMYGCFDPKGNGFEFSSQNPEHEVFVATGFDPEQCEEIEIGTKFFGGKVKYRESTPISVKQDDE